MGTHSRTKGPMDVYRFVITRRDKSERWFTDEFPHNGGRAEVMAFCEQMLMDNPDVADVNFENLEGLPYDEPLD